MMDLKGFRGTSFFFVSCGGRILMVVNTLTPPLLESRDGGQLVKHVFYNRCTSQRKTDGYTNRHANRWTDKHIRTETDLQTDGQTDIQVKKNLKRNQLFISNTNQENHRYVYITRD